MRISKAKQFSPEHLNSWSCRSATFCPFNWLGEWHLVYGARRGALRKNRDNQDKWQSHANGLSESRRARIRDIPLNISRCKAVTLLLLIVLRCKKKNEEKKFKYFTVAVGRYIASLTVFTFCIHIITIVRLLHIECISISIIIITITIEAILCMHLCTVDKRRKKLLIFLYFVHIVRCIHQTLVHITFYQNFMCEKWLCEYYTLTIFPIQPILWKLAHPCT